MIQGRARVGTARKAWIATTCLASAAADAPRRLGARFQPIVPRIQLEYADVRLRT